MRRFPALLEGLLAASLWLWPCWSYAATADLALTVTPVAVAQTPTSIAPSSASIANTAAVGQQLTTLTVGTSDGNAFAGSCGLPTNPGSYFVISGCTINVNASLSGAPGTITLGASATENSVTINQNITVTVTSGGGGGACPGGATPLVTIPGGWACDSTLSDEFNGASVDTSKWNFVVAGNQNPPNTGCLTMVNPTESGGVLHLAVTSAGGSAFNTAYDLQARNALPPNYYREVRFKPGRGAANADSTVFAFSNNTDGTHSESDTPEGTGGVPGNASGQFPRSPQFSLIWWSANYASTIGSQGFGGSYPNYYDGNFHTTGLMRNNGVWTWWYDGNQVGTANNPVSSAFVNSPDQTIIEFGFESPGCPQGPDEMQVDYYRVWHP